MTQDRMTQDRDPMVERMSPGAAAPMPRRTWWLVVLRGMAAVGFGLVAIFWPGISLAALVMLFGVYALLDGAVTLMLAFRVPPNAYGRAPGRSILMATGIAGLVVGLVSVLWPQATVTLLIYVLAGWLVLFGLIALTHSLQMRKQVADWPLSRGGLLLLVIGLLLALFPDAVALAATWVLGILALLIGGGLLAFAWRRQQRDRMVL